VGAVPPDCQCDGFPANIASVIPVDAIENSAGAQGVVFGAKQAYLTAHEAQALLSTGGSSVPDSCAALGVRVNHAQHCSLYQ
jgi:hypothetical protein